MDIDRGRIVAEAVRRTGLEDFGDQAYAEGLDRLIASLKMDKALRNDAVRSIEQRLTGVLEQRLHLYGDRQRHPEIAAQTIERPLIVIGLPRSGTTFLHALLSRDPAARSPLSWQIGSLSPPPRSETIDSDPRIAATDEMLAHFPEELKIMHLVGATLPDECNAFMTMAFLSPHFDASWDVPAYVDWFMTADARPGYDLHRHVLQHLQAFTDGAHWVLKSPPHMFHMSALIQAYPDARIVFPHRDPVVTIPSLASLISAVRGLTYPDVDRPRIGRQQMDMWATAMDRTLAFRDDPAQADRFVDVYYDSLVADPMGTVRSIYARFDMVLTEEAEAAMQRFLADKPKDKHGVHRYTLEDAGLTRAEIQSRFARYFDNYLVG